MIPCPLANQSLTTPPNPRLGLSDSPLCELSNYFTPTEGFVFPSARWQERTHWTAHVTEEETK